MPLFALLAYRLALPAHLAFFRAAQSRQQAQQRGFTGAVRSFDLYDIARRHAERQAVEQRAFVANAREINDFEHAGGVAPGKKWPG